MIDKLCRKINFTGSTFNFQNSPLFWKDRVDDITYCLDIAEKVDISKKAYLGDESLVLLFAIYSRLRLEPFKCREEQKTALHCFDKLLDILSIRNKALEAMGNVLN
ncbi:hypothetical protein FBD94_02405 [Pedobacter hiemivivus]|uniref:Uncharacterized protein n=1 Tax=Pedobacter hiemivivus TaxID=2530454 RepID=A0A4U1GN17_9SPHI|nr:hypothetical protein [Pedobacter hiemivivus]TKC65424.1 hypothetical protein FBD94_02405 [Pedobacter hiemivivus]